MLEELFGTRNLSSSPTDMSHFIKQLDKLEMKLIKHTYFASNLQLHTILGWQINFIFRREGGSHFLVVHVWLVVHSNPRCLISGGLFLHSFSVILCWWLSNCLFVEKSCHEALISKEFASFHPLECKKDRETEVEKNVDKKMFEDASKNDYALCINLSRVFSAHLQKYTYLQNE